MNRLKKGDTVIVITVRDKGRQGTVVGLRGENRVLVEGVNLVKKHQRGNPQAGKAGGIIQKEMPIHVSNIAHYNQVTKKADRIGCETPVNFFTQNRPETRRGKKQDTAWLENTMALGRGGLNVIDQA